MISERAKQISPSPTLAITAKAKQMKAEGIDVISFGAGEPDFDTPQFIKDAAIKSMQEGFTKYTPVQGTAGLKKAISDKLKRDNGLDYKANEIMVSVGAKHSIYNAVMATVNPGDEVIIPTPYWVSYPEIVKMAGGMPVYVEALEENGFCITAEQLKSAITDKTKMFILNSPSNPTGGCYSENQLKELADVIVAKDILVLSDEIYETIVYDGAKHISIASFGEDIKKHTILINGHSKAYSMTGWRIGYAACDSAIISAMGKIQGHSTSNPVSFTQTAAEVALNADQSFLKEMLNAFDERRKYIVMRLNDIEGMSCSMPKGAFYAFPNISALLGKTFDGKVLATCDDLCAYFLDNAKVALVAGSGFGAPNYIRLSYATSMENIKEGLDRIEKAVAELK
ncbi:MAG: pyridoxal phosphate-dependent aminotransferase [Armatimonadetes bacterium]|nr:pyridoxal phosphate-dependent aminotransferase [Candidatus Hippobium faecium]